MKLRLFIEKSVTPIIHDFRIVSNFFFVKSRILKKLDMFYERFCLKYSLFRFSKAYFTEANID